MVSLCGNGIFNIIKDRNCSSTLYHAISTSNDSKKESLLKTLWEKEEMLEPAFSPFPTTFSAFPKTNFNISVTFILSSVNAFNLD